MRLYFRINTALQGLEAAVTRTPESFSLCDITEWLKLLSAAHLYDLAEKRASLSRVSCTPSSMEQVYCVWEKPDGLAGNFYKLWCIVQISTIFTSDDRHIFHSVCVIIIEVLEHISYTVAHVHVKTKCS